MNFTRFSLAPRRGVSNSNFAHFLLALLLVCTTWLTAAVDNTQFEYSTSFTNQLPLYPGEQVEYDIQYGPHSQNELDLFLPAGNTPAALVIWMHGGGFINGDKGGIYNNNDFVLGIRQLLDNGIAFASINYQLLAEFGEEEGVQRCLSDAALAVQFLRYHATTYNLDPGRFGFIGGSAGASTALWLATTDDLAEATAPNPVRRMSTRIQAVGLKQVQSTLDVFRWEELLQLGLPSVYVLYHIHEDIQESINRLYGVSTFDELLSPEIAAYRQDVDMYGQLSSDDSPIWARTEQVQSTNFMSYLNHHPNHVAVIKRRATQLGVENVTYTPTDGHPSGEELFPFMIRILGGQTSPVASCDDGMQNGQETGVDCGGPDCVPCASCDDGIQNGEEEGIDCGGPDCVPCTTCGDGMQNGQETGVDCGGPDCLPCQINCQWKTIDESGFETGDDFWEVMTPGGTIVSATAIGGRYAAMLRNGYASSQILSECMNLGAVEELEVTFNILTIGMEASDYFSLEISYDCGGNWQEVRRYNRGADFQNYRQLEFTEVLSGPFTPNTSLRIKLYANQNNDRLYLDELFVGACQIGSASNIKVINTRPEANQGAGMIDQIHEPALVDIPYPKATIYPNPSMANSDIYLRFNEPTKTVCSARIIDLNGRVIIEWNISSDAMHTRIPTEQLAAGMYFVVTKTGRGRLIERLVIQ